MTQTSIVDQCFQQIKELAYPNQIKIKNIIQKYISIKPKPLQPLYVTQHHSLKNIQNLQEEFYQQKFVPSPQLISNYQTTYLKSLRGQKPSSIVNSKLKQLYQTKNSNFKGEKSSLIPQSYKNLNRGYHQKTNLAQNKRIFIENKQQTILNTLKQQKGQFALDKMEASLIQNQLSNLNKKGVVIEQTTSLLDWKQKRKNMEKQFKQYKK